MMNKNMLLAASLMFSVVTTALPVGEQEREILYTINELGQDFGDVPLIKQNIDTFIGILEMHIAIAEGKLATVNQKVKGTLMRNAVALVGVSGTRVFADQLIEILKYKLGVHPRSLSFGPLNLSVKSLGQLVALLSVTSCSYIALNVREAVMTKYNANTALELDKAILEKLIDVKEAMIFDIDETSAGSSLLENVDQGE